jgi:hypothetical protein
LFFANKTTKNKFLSSYLLIYAHQIEREGSEGKGKEGKGRDEALGSLLLRKKQTPILFC